MTIDRKQTEQTQNQIEQKSLHYLTNSDNTSIIIDLDQRFQAFRSALLQDPRPTTLTRVRDELVGLIDHLVNHSHHQSSIITPSSVRSINTPSLAYHQQLATSYFPSQPESPLKKQQFPLKLERKRSRERLDGHHSTHNPKAARSDGSLNSSAGLLSRRTSQSITSPLVSASSTLTDFNINGLLSPSSNPDPSQPLTSSTLYPNQPQPNPSSGNSQFTTINHPSHPPQFHQISQHLSQNLPCDSPNTHNCPSTAYSTLNTPLISPHDLSINSNTADNPLLMIFNNQLNHHPDLNLSRAEHSENFLASNESQLGVKKPNSLHVQLSDMMPEGNYQQLPDHKPADVSSTSIINSKPLRGPPINTSTRVDSTDGEIDQAHFTSNDPKPGQFEFHHHTHLPTTLGEGDRSCAPNPLHIKPITSMMIPGSELPTPTVHPGAESSQLSQPSHNFSPPLGIRPSSTRVPLSSHPAPKHSQSTSRSQQDFQDEVMSDDTLTQSSTLPSTEQSSTVGIQVYRSTQDLEKQTRSRAGTMESVPQPSQRKLFTTTEEASRSPKKEEPSSSKDTSTQSFQSTSSLQFHSTSTLTSTSMPPPPPDSSLVGGTSSSTTYHQQQPRKESHPPARVPSPPVNKQMGAASAGVSEELAAQFEPIFTNWLGKLCSDLDMKDSKGEPIHQTLMARKMQRLEESADFRPFKFRIQAFTNSFFEELVRHGFKENDLPMKKVRQYLWSQSCISRFNEEGKKAKSKGNHVWHIEAQKILNGQWNFLHFQSKIIANPPSEAYAGLKWSWAPKVWDPQCSAQNIKAVFSSPELPSWLSWNGNVLNGTPGPDLIGTEYEIVVVATTNPHHKRSSLDLTFKLTVKSPEEMVTVRKESKQAKESSLTALRRDSHIHSTSEQASNENTPNQSPPDISGLASRQVDVNYSASHPQLPNLSRTDSNESVPISTSSLEDLHRQSTNRLSTRTGLMGGNDLEFDSKSAASVLNRMSATTMESVVDALGPFSDLSASVNDHQLGLHMVPQAGLSSTCPAGMIATEGQMNGLSDLSNMMMPSNPASVTNLHVPSMMIHTTNVGANDGTGMLNQMMNSSNLMPSTPSTISPPGPAMEMGHPGGHTNPSADLTSCGQSSCTDRPPTTAVVLEEVVQLQEAVAAQQHAVAMHEARLQTVRENLMSSDMEISDSAGNLMRSAIISDDPVARQFAADVLAPLTSSACSTAISAPASATGAEPGRLPLARPRAASSSAPPPANPPLSLPAGLALQPDPASLPPATGNTPLLLAHHHHPSSLPAPRDSLQSAIPPQLIDHHFENSPDCRC